MNECPVDRWGFSSVEAWECNQGANRNWKVAIISEQSCKSSGAHAVEVWFQPFHVRSKFQ